MDAPSRLAVLFDGNQSDIQNMAAEAVRQLAETAKGLDRELLMKGAQTMDVRRGGIVNWSNWVRASAFDRDQRIQYAHCYRSNNVLVGALHALAVENENLARAEPLGFPPRLMPEKIDAILIVTGRSRPAMVQEFAQEQERERLLYGAERPTIRNPLRPLARAFRPLAGHRGLVAQGTPIYGLTTTWGVESILQDKLSAPTGGLSFHGTSRDVKDLVDVMAVTLADTSDVRGRLAGNRFAVALLGHEES